MTKLWCYLQHLHFQASYSVKAVMSSMQAKNGRKYRASASTSHSEDHRKAKMHLLSVQTPYLIKTISLVVHY